MILKSVNPARKSINDARIESKDTKFNTLLEKKNLIFTLFGQKGPLLYQKRFSSTFLFILHP